MEHLGDDELKIVLKAQKQELTQYLVYNTLSKAAHHKKNKEVLQHLAHQEMQHYHFWKRYTKRHTKAHNFYIYFYLFFSYIFGLTFALVLMERWNNLFFHRHFLFFEKLPHAKDILRIEEHHWKKFLRYIKEERLEFLDSVILGLNDAMVELTGALSGFTLALTNTKMIGFVGLIVGVAGSMSMGASEYLSQSSTRNGRAIRSALYTGITYLITVLILTSPFFLFSHKFFNLALSISFAIVLIFIFTFYISVTKQFSFYKKFFEMLFLSLGIALITFCFTYVMRTFFGVAV